MRPKKAKPPDLSEGFACPGRAGAYRDRAHGGRLAVRKRAGPRGRETSRTGPLDHLYRGGSVAVGSSSPFVSQAPLPM